MDDRSAVSSRGRERGHGRGSHGARYLLNCKLLCLLSHVQSQNLVLPRCRRSLAALAASESQQGPSMHCKGLPGQLEQRCRQRSL